MKTYRSHLPQLDGGLFLTDGGLETMLIFQEGLELPEFASFDILRTVKGKELLKEYYVRYLSIAWQGGYGFVLDSPTWRASSDWGEKLGYSKEALAAVNREAIEQLAALRRQYQTPALPIVVSGQVGPRGDSYDPGRIMNVFEARDYHAAQINTFAETEADMITAQTITNVEEAIGITEAAQAVGLPAAVSFTVETDGRLPTGQGLGEAIVDVDEATGRGPAYYMVNCAHPSHFAEPLSSGGEWRQRIRGVRANASACSHAELDNSTVLDDGDPEDFGAWHADLLLWNPQIAVLGGCCGTDHRHLQCVSAACKKAA